MVTRMEISHIRNLKPSVTALQIVLMMASVMNKKGYADHNQ